MKIAFINNANESLGIEYLSAALKQQGHQVRVFIDPQLFNDENIRFSVLEKIFDYRWELVKDVVDFAPDLIGFSVVSDFYKWACSVAAQIKFCYEKPIIFGGIHPTSLPEQVLRNNFVDMVCVGEGEAALVEVVACLERGEWPEKIENIWTKKNGAIIKNKVRPLVSDLNLLPYPDKELFYKESRHYEKGYFTMAARGCLYACSYCHHSYLKKMYNGASYYRCRSVENVIKELERNFIRHKHKIIRFSDDIFPFEKQWLREFAAKFPKRINAPYICYLHPHTTDQETVSLLKKSGCREVQLGVQTLYANTQKEILNRHVAQKRWEELILLLRKSKIRITAENIIGIPHQSEEEIKDLVRFYCKNKVDRIHVFWLRYYPRTKITEQFKPEQFDGQGLQTNTFTQGGDVYSKQLSKLRVLFVLLNFLPPGVIYFILEKKIYKYTWPVSLFLLDLISNIFSGSYADKITRQREFQRYLIYIKRSLGAYNERVWGFLSDACFKRTGDHCRDHQNIFKRLIRSFR
ncbi:MAG: radical SAM protein [Candidatus Omnitrophota bacterium]